MTYEELKLKLADIAHEKDAHEARNDFLLALRAVVELHKPEKEKLAEPFVVDFCHKCKQIYPCETIEIIEKELQ